MTIPRDRIQLAKSLIDECRLIASMTEEPGRTTRRFLTPPVAHVHAHLRRRMTDLGMTVSTDAIGNLRGLWQPASGSARRLVLGSHIDTIPNAGAFDGVLGVVLALELVPFAQRLAGPYAIEVIAFSEEEGMRFNRPFLGSRAVAGRFDPAMLELTDAAGITLAQAIRDFGLDPVGIPDAQVAHDAMGFFELHIEQGPVLEAEGLSIGVVSAIVGQSRWELVFYGHANHAGTTPMGLRRDALAAAAEWIAAVEQTARTTDQLVATVGSIQVTPNAPNVVPARALVTLDIRSPHDSVRAQATEFLLALAQSIAASRFLACEVNLLMDQSAVPMDEELTELLTESVAATGLAARRLPSGAGHDAMVMATRLPTAMLFLRSPAGLSHHPDESVLPIDIAAALQVSERFLLRLSSRAS
jgi:allantoate deiminase